MTDESRSDEEVDAGAANEVSEEMEIGPPVLFSPSTSQWGDCVVQEDLASPPIPEKLPSVPKVLSDLLNSGA